MHRAADDLCAALTRDASVLALWATLTPLERNEFICRVEHAKKPANRARRIKRTREELLEGRMRPCCRAACIHRTNEVPGRWQQAMPVEGRGHDPARTRHA